MNDLFSAHYTNWHPRQPKIDGGVTFAVLDWARGKWGWKNLAGHEYKYYICEVKQHNGMSTHSNVVFFRQNVLSVSMMLVRLVRAKNPNIISTFSVSQGCQTTSCQRQAAGLRDQLIWDRFLDNEYVVQDRCAKKRSDAAATCRQQGAQLVTIESSAEMRFVQRLLREKAYDMDDAPSWWTNGVYVNRRWQWQGSSECPKQKFLKLLLFTTFLRTPGRRVYPQERPPPQKKDYLMVNFVCFQERPSCTRTGGRTRIRPAATFSFCTTTLCSTSGCGPTPRPLRNCSSSASAQHSHWNHRQATATSSITFTQNEQHFA